MAVNPITYVKNVGKSLGYIAVDALSSTSPAMKELISDNKDTISDLYHQIKDFSSSPMDKVRSNQKIMSYSNDIKTGLQNLVSDIKTGNFYNQARSDDAMNAMLGLDFDFDSMFEDDFNFDEELSSSNSFAAAAVAEGSNKEILAMDVVGSRISTAVGSATAKSAEYIVNANAESTRAILSQNNKIFNALSTGMVGINQTLGSIAQLGEPLTQHMQNASVFYTKSTENQLKIIDLLEKIEKNTNRPVATKSGSGRKVTTIDDYLTGSGVLDLGKMLSMAKGNAKTAFDSSMLGMLFSMNDMLGEGTLTKMFASNPLGMILPMVLEGAIMTDDLKKSLSGFSNALSAMSRKAIRDLNGLKNSSNPILSFIGELFKLDSGSGERKYKGDYEKGAVSFDGYTRQAIVKVIPEYLSMILKAVGGGSQRYYDYEKGKFTTAKDIRNKMKEDNIRAINRLGYDIKVEAESINAGDEEIDINILNKAFDNYIANAIKYGESRYIFMNTVLKEDKFKDYGFKSKDEFKAFQKYIVNVKNPNNHNRFDLDYLNAKIDNERKYRAENSYKSTDVESYLLDNSQFTYTRSRESESGSGSRRGKKNKNNKKNNKSDNESDASDKEKFDKAGIRKRLLDAGFSEDGQVFTKIMKDYDKLDAKRENLTDKEIEDFLKRVDDNIRNKNKTNGKGFITAQEALNKVQSFLEAPLSAVADMLNKGTKAIYNIMYGKDGEEDNKSILGHIFTNMKDMFTDFKDWTKETIFDPIKKLIDDHGGIKGLFEDFFGIKTDDIKNKFNEIKTNVKDKFKSAGRWAWRNSRMATAYRNYRAERWNERNYADTEDMYFNQQNGNGPSEDSFDEYDELLHRNSGNGSGLVKRKKRKFRGGASETNENPMFGEQVINEGKNAILSFIHAIFPDKKELEKDMGKIGEVAKTGLEQLKLDPSGAITGALIGTGISILTGGIVGPFLAASLGGAAGLTINSQAVQKALFGEVDEEGNASGGLLSSKISTFLTRDLKKVAGFGIDGAVLGLLPFVPGGPITGLLLGSAIGFANREGKLSDAIFGEKDDEGNRTGGYISKEFQEKVKKLAPKAAVGAIAGLVAGPFGLIPNIIIGAGIGFASETEKFKSIIFGEDTGEKDKEGNPIRKGGITGWIRNDIISPVASAIRPIADEIKFKGKKLLNSLGDKIANVFKVHVGLPLWTRLRAMTGPIGRMFGKVFGGIGKIVATPFQAVGRLGENLKYRQVAEGRGSMSAAERQKIRQSPEYQEWLATHPRRGSNADTENIDRFTALDASMAAMDVDKLNALKNDINTVRKQSRKAINVANKSMNAIIVEVDNRFGHDIAKKFAKTDFVKSYKNGESYKSMTELVAALASVGIILDDETKPIFKDLLDSFNAKSQSAWRSDNTNVQKALDDLKSRLREAGLDEKEIDKINANNAYQYIDRIDQEIWHRKNGTEAIGAEDPVASAVKDSTSRVTNWLKAISNILIRGLHLENSLGQFDFGTDDNSFNPGSIFNREKENKGEESSNPSLSEDARDNFMDEAADRLATQSGTGSKLKKWIGRGALVGAASGIFGIMKTKIDGQGQESLDMADKETRESIKLRDAVFNGFEDIKNYVKGIYSEVSEESLLENGEGGEKKSIFEKLFGGEGGLFGKAKNWLKGALPTILVTAGLAVFAKLGLEGKLNDISAKLGIAGRDNLNQGTDSGTDYTQWTGITEDGKVEAVATDEKGNPIMDDEGNYISTNGNVVTGIKSVYGNTNATMQQKLISNTARSVVTGSGVVAQIGKNVNKLSGGRIGKVAGKVGTKIATKVGGTAAAQAAHAAGTAAVNGLLGKIVEQLTKIATKLSTLPMLKGLGGAIQGMSDDIAETMAKNAAKKSAAEIGKGVLSTAAFAAKIVLIAIDFEEGYNSARRTLGIKEPTTGQKIISGLLRVLKNLIPVIGSLIPDKLIVNIAVKWIAPAMGIDTSKFMQQQADAQAELDAYNKENGTNLTWDEYVKQEGLESTWGEGIVNGVKTIGAKVGSGFKKAGSKISSGIQKAKTAISTGIDNIKTGIGKAKEIGQDAFKAAGNSIKKLSDFAKNGDLKGLMSSTYKPVNANGEEEENGIVDKIFSKVYDVAKVLSLPSTAISWVGHKLIGGIKEKINSIKQNIQKTVNAFKQMADYAKDGNISSIWAVNTNEEGGEKGGVVNLILSGISTVGKVIYTMIGIIHKVTNPIKKIVDAALGGIANIKDKIVHWFDGKDAPEDVEELAEDESLSGGGSFVSQVDPSVSNRHFGSSTIGELGCAPSVASMITGAPLSATAKYASRRGYTNKNGTSADYFESVFSETGIPAEYVYTGGGSAQDYLASRIASGSPTVLLGQDPYNTSKAYSPFGPGNHYVLATGMTNDGGIVVQDPESRTPNNIYDSSILNSVKLGIPTGGKSGIIGKLRKLYGGSVRYLPSKGRDRAYLSDEVAKLGYGEFDSSIGGFPANNGNVLTLENAQLKFPDAIDDTLNVEDYTESAKRMGYTYNRNAGKLSEGAAGIGFIYDESTDSFIYKDKNNHEVSISREFFAKKFFPNATDDVGPKIPEDIKIKYAQAYTTDSRYWTDIRRDIDNYTVIETTNGVSKVIDSTASKTYRSQAEFLADHPEYSNSSGYSKPLNFKTQQEYLDYIKKHPWYNNFDKDKFLRNHFRNNFRTAEEYLEYANSITGKNRERVKATLDKNKTTKIETTEERGIIWQFFINKGLSEFAVAGIMGCFEAEGRNEFDRIEGDTLSIFPGGKTKEAKDALVDNINAYTDYTINIYLPYVMANNKVKRTNGYSGGDGKYYCGIGICQWTGGRAKAFLNFVKKSRVKWSDPATQLEYLWTELNGSYKSTLNNLKDPNKVRNSRDAAKIFALGFENGNMTQAQIRKRQDYASSIYTEFTGKTFDVNIQDTSSGGYLGSIDSSTTGTNTTGKNDFSLLDFGSMFGKLVAARFGKLGKLFGLSTGDEEDQTTSGEENQSENNPTSADYQKDVVGTTAADSTSSSSSIISKTASVANYFPYYNQSAEPWGSKQYSIINDPSQTISSSGCGPTSMAMVLKSYGKQYDPATAAQYSLDNGFRTEDSGTAWGFFSSLGQKEGLTVESISDPEIVKEKLANNIPIIASMTKGDFTNGGHFIVLSGLKNGALMVNDPNSTDRTGKLWNIDKVLAQAKNFWAISKNGVGSLYSQLNFRNQQEYLDYIKEHPDYQTQNSTSLIGYYQSLEGQWKDAEMAGYGDYSGGFSNLSANGFPYYYQKDNDWRSNMYSVINNPNQNIGTSGCGPTSMAMVLKSYGKQYDPATAAQYSLDNGFRTEDSGTLWSFFDSLGQKEGLSVEELEDPAIVKDKLANNIPIIASMNKGDFTNGSGHFVVLSGLKNGELKVNDPNSYDRTSKLWNIDNTLSQAKRFWAISKNGIGSLNSYKSTGSLGNFKNENEWLSYNNLQTQLNSNSSNVIKDNDDVYNYQSEKEFLASHPEYGGGSGLVYNIAQDGLNTVHRRHRGAKSAFGGSSGLINLSKYSASRKAKYYRDLRGGASDIDSMGNNEALIVMIKACISLLSNVSANSDKINEIISAINNLASSTNSKITDAQIDNAETANNIKSTDETLTDLTNLLHSLAAGA